MKPESLRVAKLFQNGGNIYYVLPLCRRQYTWAKCQWQTLLDDARALHGQVGTAGGSAADLEHPLGSVVVINDGTHDGIVPVFQVAGSQ